MFDIYFGVIPGILVGIGGPMVLSAGFTILLGMRRAKASGKKVSIFREYRAVLIMGLIGICLMGTVDPWLRSTLNNAYANAIESAKEELDSAISW